MTRRRPNPANFAAAIALVVLAGLASACTAPAASAPPSASDAMMDHSAAPSDAMMDHSAAPSDAMMEHSPEPSAS
jgi:hypothetical protein